MRLHVFLNVFDHVDQTLIHKVSLNSSLCIVLAKHCILQSNTPQKVFLLKAWPPAQDFASFLQTGHFQTFKLAPVQLVPLCATFLADFA